MSLLSKVLGPHAVLGKHLRAVNITKYYKKKNFDRWKGFKNQTTELLGFYIPHWFYFFLLLLLLSLLLLLLLLLSLSLLLLLSLLF